MIDEIKKSWGWQGLEPVKILAENEFGNLIIEDIKGKIWRICPEDVYCKVIADSINEFEKLYLEDEFKEDWEMKNLLQIAKDKFGELIPGRKYCLKIPGILGGEYSLDNIGTIDFLELIQFSGDLGNQIKDVPDGTTIDFKFIE